MWIESHQNLGTHKKLIRLCSLLKFDRFRAVGLLHYLWWWALDNAPDGDLSGMTGEEIAQAIGFRGDGALLMRALINSGWVDFDGEYQGGDLCKAQLHDWYEYAGKLLDRRNANREKVARYRNRHVTVTDTVTTPLGNGATVPNLTVPLPPTPTTSAAAPKNVDVKDGDIFRAYESAFGMMLTPTISESLQDMEQEYGRRWVVDALKETVESGARTLKYTRSILDRWKTQGRNGRSRDKPKDEIPYFRRLKEDLPK
jgi:DnaD/phage-associated family protein